jgi:hypothetical protein
VRFFVVLLSSSRESTSIRLLPLPSKPVPILHSPITLPFDDVQPSFLSLGGVRLSPLGTSAIVGLLYQPRMIDDDY